MNRDLSMTDDEVRARLIDSFKKVKAGDMKFGVWLSKRVVENLHIKNSKTKQVILSCKWCLAVRSESINKTLKETDQHAVIDTIKSIIRKALGVTDGIRMFKLNGRGKAKNLKFIVVPFNVTDITVNFNITYAEKQKKLNEEMLLVDEIRHTLIRAGFDVPGVTGDDSVLIRLDDPEKQEVEMNAVLKKAGYDQTIEVNSRESAGLYDCIIF